MNTSFQTHTVKSFGEELDRLSDDVARMGGLVETLVTDCVQAVMRRDGELASAGPSLTMRWDALPRSGGGSGLRTEPGDLALSAGRRVEAALLACGPRLRPMVARICIAGDSLQLAETGLGLRRRQGKTLLKQGLQALAEHYGL